MNASVFASTQKRKNTRSDLAVPLKRSSIPAFQFDPASPAKNLKNIFTHQSTIIDRLFCERDDLVERVQTLEERLSNSLSMISVQKARIVNLSELSARLSASGPAENNRQPPAPSQIAPDDKIIVEQILKLSLDQIPLYLAHNPFPLQCTLTSPQLGAERINSVLTSLPSQVAVPFASAAFAQLFRSSEISELVQTLRKSIHNHQFIHKIEAFCCKLFKAGFCQLFALQPQQNQLVTLFDSDGFTLQVPVGQGIVGSCAKEGKILIYQSTQESPSYDPEIDDFFNIGSNPSLLIPIFDSSSNFVISVILVHSPKVGALFTPEDLQVGEILSSQISPFLTAYVEHMEKNEDRSYRSELSLAVKSLLGKNTLEELLQTTLQVVQRMIKAENAELYLIDDEQGLLYVFEPQSSHNGVQMYVRKYFSGKSGIPFHVIKSLSVVNINRLTPEKCEFFSRETDVVALGKPYLAVPVFAVGEKPIAVLAAYGKSGSNLFSPSDIAALQQLSVQVGVNLTNIFASQSAQETQQTCSADVGNFSNPLNFLIKQIAAGDEDSMIDLAEAISLEAIKRLNCDLIALWQVINNRPVQRYICKSQEEFIQIVDIPPVVNQVIESGEIKISAVAAEVQQMMGSFDDEASYKSYSNITMPIKDQDGKIIWIVIAENSLSAQGRFTDTDVAGLTEYSSFLIAATNVVNLQGTVESNEKAISLQKTLISTLTPVKTDMLNRLIVAINDSFDSKYCALYQADGIAEALTITETNYPDAPKSIMLTQGIIGKLFTTNESHFYNDIYNESEFNAPTDAFGLDDMNSAIYCKVTNSFLMVLLSPEKNKFNEQQVQAILGASDLVQIAYELSRNFNEGGSTDSSIVTAEQRATFMSRSSSPTRSDLEEYSDRFFNIMNYNEDDRIIMILKMFVSQGVIRKLQVPFQKLVQFVCTVRSCYNETPYHNWTHACDVTQFAFSCIMRGRLRLYLQDIELFALLLACVCHDVDHHGLNNAFHKKARTPLGILYDERPVMEMHHAATAIRLLEMPEHDILEGIENPSEKSHFYEFFIKIILATDMDKHFAYIKEFEEMSSDFDKRNERHRLLLAQIVMKSGDVSNTTRAFDVASDMSHKLTDEFFKQGDLERQLGIEVTPMCDRTKASHISTSQVGFYGFIAAPLLTALGNFITALADNTDQLEKNKRQWEQQKEQWELSQQK
ncbi:3'5'-cyclic nucleotide phosphodiesterase family protein [Tritrichomonas foetus]|uniref:Phosphodiesterase n=1 Tax=Tritrichomonas foetus TaxID=1144522 RepID=A0A1J4J696_9EUKA|nr:3'5'-cyclic nucleotide phosphodiesterase family protein [Tritrichomonas foetus]|eukprot:OHS94193.1 3'5'-cyclic nucleotide phosphodiesterase family protein [Tritrichomonas foetus]